MLANAPADLAHRSRWGYHACSYQTYLELKQYHQLLYRAYCQHKRWLAWARKTVKRTGPEPQHQAKLSVPNHLTGSHQFVRYGDRSGPNLYLHLLQQYRVARHPYPTQAEVPPLDLPEDWRDRLGELTAVYGS
jgi:hypothetical protein